MQKKPFWEQLYADMEVSTFSKGPTVDVNEFSAMPDNAPYTHSLFDVGELPEKYKDWEIIHHHEGTFRDSHPAIFTMNMLLRGLLQSVLVNTVGVYFNTEHTA